MKYLSLNQVMRYNTKSPFGCHCLFGLSTYHWIRLRGITLIAHLVFIAYLLVLCLNSQLCLDSRPKTSKYAMITKHKVDVPLVLLIVVKNLWYLICILQFVSSPSETICIPACILFYKEILWYDYVPYVLYMYPNSVHTRRLLIGKFSNLISRSKTPNALI